MSFVKVTGSFELLWPAAVEGIIAVIAIPSTHAKPRSTFPKVLTDVLLGGTENENRN